MELQPRLEGAAGRLSAPVEHLTKQQARSLYISHALSTWNARTYEAGAVLFTAAAWPNTLLMSSLRGLFTTFVVLATSSYIGQAIDRSRERLTPLLYSITAGRVSIILACLGWLPLLSEAPVTSLSGPLQYSMFAFVVLAGIAERLTATANTITMERDWVPVLASDSEQPAGAVYTLTALNSVMRRIDLSCKLFSPLLISLVIVMTSHVVGVWLVLAMNVASLGLEWISAKYVWNTNPRLHEKEFEPVNTRRSLSVSRNIAEPFRQQWTQLKKYFSNDVWIPSLALALLHLSALSYAATFVTFLLTSGFSLLIVTVARTAGSIVEVSSTYAVPYGVRRLSQIREIAEDGVQHEQLLSEDQEENKVVVTEHITGVARSGLWGLSLQLASLVPVIWVIFQITKDGKEISTDYSILLSKQFSLSMRAETPSSVSFWAALTMFGFLSISRLGLWTFDLTTQELTQSLVPSSQRSSFAGSETSFVALFELAQWIFAAIFSRPAQFKWLALGSGIAVAVSSIMYAFWVRKRRGHLLHWENLNSTCCKLR